MREAVTEIGAKTGLKAKEAVSKFFHDLEDYEGVLGAESILQGLQTEIETKKLEAENWQAKEQGLRRKHDDLKEAIGAIYALRAKGVKVSQIMMWQRILNRFGTTELRLAQVQSQVETLDKERSKIEAAIDALKVAGVKELKGMTEAAGKQLKAVAATQIRQTQDVGQEVRKGLDNLFAQLDALGEKAIEVGRTVGIVEEQLRKDGKARDLLNLLQNPVAAGYEEYLPLVLVLLKSIGVWAGMNKSKFSYYILLEKNLEEAKRYLGGG